MSKTPTAHFSFDSVVRGYHVYRFFWPRPFKGGKLDLAFDLDCPASKDPHAMSVMRNKKTVGHVPVEISEVVKTFIKRGGTTECVINDKRKRSKLPQGGLEVPCTYIFRHNEERLMKKLRKILTAVKKTW